MSKRIIPVGLGFSLFWLAVPTWSQPTAPTIPNLPAGPGATDYLWTLIALALVLTLIWVIARIAGRLGGMASSTGGQLRVIGGVAIGTRERVVLIQVGRKQVLLGVTQGQIERLCVLSGEDLVASAEPPVSAFSRQFMAALRNRDGQA